MKPFIRHFARQTIVLQSVSEYRQRQKVLVFRAVLI